MCLCLCVGVCGGVHLSVIDGGFAYVLCRISIPCLKDFLPVFSNTEKESFRPCYVEIEECFHGCIYAA